MLFIADEIQSGLGRTGKLFAYMHEDITPDVVIVGKALSGGFYPVSAVLSSKEVLGVFNPGDHGSTFGGNPLGCAVARAALRVLIEEKLVETLGRTRRLFPDQAEDAAAARICRKCAAKACGSASNSTSPARPYCEALKKLGILCKETHDHVIRIAPPLTITREEIIWAFDRIKKVIEKAK